MKKEVEGKHKCFKELVNLCKSSTTSVTVFIKKRRAATRKAEVAQQTARVQAEAAAKKDKYAAAKKKGSMAAADDKSTIGAGGSQPLSSLFQVKVGTGRMQQMMSFKSMEDFLEKSAQSRSLGPKS